MSILVVDDAPGATYAISISLQPQRWKILTAGSGPEALDILRRNRDIEVLATDFSMPDMDGAQLINQALAMRPDLYTIVFTAYQERSFAIRALRVGADDFVEKDHDFDSKLLAAVRRGLQQVALNKMGEQALKLAHEDEVLDGVFALLRGLGRFDGFCLAARRWNESCRIERAEDLRADGRPEVSESLSEESAYRHVIETGDLFYPPMFIPERGGLRAHLEGSRSILVVPVRLHGGEPGALGIEHHEPDRFKIDDLRFMRQVANVVSVANENIANTRRVVLERARGDRKRGLLARALLHEIKNPLYLLGSAAHALQERFDDEEVRYLVTNVERINGVLDKFLRPLSPHSGQERPVSLGKALEEAVTRFRLYNPKSGVRLEYDVAPVLPLTMGDEEMLVYAFVDLLQNGLAAAGDSGRLSVRARYVPLRDEVEIAFEDDGPGIKPADFKRIFDYGYSTHGEGHTGYGLALIQEVVELHGGRITPESHAGGGATFSIVLPVREIAAMTKSPDGAGE